MLKELIDYVDSLLPAVPLDKSEGLKAAITQFEKEGQKVKWLMINPLDKLSQGDIISNIPFQYFESDGQQKTFKADALVLSTSCHIDNKDKIVLVPVMPIEDFKGNEMDLKKNTIVDFMYIPDGKLKNCYVDFEVMNTFSKELISKAIENKKVSRIASLNQLGYYLFIVKLTLYLMRREDAGTQEERNIGFSY